MFAVTFIISVLTLLYTCFKWQYAYWKRRGVPFIPPMVPLGNLRTIKTNGAIFQDFYREFKNRGCQHGGVYVLHVPVYIPIDPTIIKSVITSDFNHFNEMPFFVNEKDQPVSAHLFAIGGETWKVLRQKLTPAFTSGKMKMMLSTLVQCRLPVLDHLADCWKTKTAVNIKEVAAMFTTDVIGSVGFGIDCNTFENPNSDFRRHGKAIFEGKPSTRARSLFQFVFPELSRKLGLVVFPKDAEAFFTKIVLEIVDYRERSNVTRNDFMQLLINLKNTGSSDACGAYNEKNRITLNELVVQACTFFVASFETTSTTIAFCLFELAQDQLIQDGVRDEIRQVLEKYDGEITYEALGELVYMQLVIDETLRKYPPLPTLDRKCTKDYKVPGTDVTIEAGTGVTISTYGLHRDPQYYPDPDRFDPERFSAKNVAERTPYTYLPFGEGPRMCIGLRFGLMQTKVALVSLLQNFRYTLNEKTSPVMEYNLSFILNAKGDILLDVAEVN